MEGLLLVHHKTTVDMTWLHHIPLIAKYFLHTVAANLDSFQSMPLVVCIFCIEFCTIFGDVDTTLCTAIPCRLSLPKLYQVAVIYLTIQLPASYSSFNSTLLQHIST